MHFETQVFVSKSLVKTWQNAKACHNSYLETNLPSSILRPRIPSPPLALYTHQIRNTKSLNANPIPFQHKPYQIVSSAHPTHKQFIHPPSWRDPKNAGPSQLIVVHEAPFLFLQAPSQEGKSATCHVCKEGGVGTCLCTHFTSTSMLEYSTNQSVCQNYMIEKIIIPN